jgi:hypothetical protein
MQRLVDRLKTDDHAAASWSWCGGTEAVAWLLRAADARRGATRTAFEVLQRIVPGAVFDPYAPERCDGSRSRSARSTTQGRLITGCR